MDKTALKKALKFAAGLLLFLSLGLMVITVWLEDFYLSIGSIVVSVVSLAVTILSAEKFDIKEIWKDLNIYFFLVSIVVCLSVTISSQILFYIGLVLFIFVILLYFIPLFVVENEDKKNKKSMKKKNKR